MPPTINHHNRQPLRHSNHTRPSPCSSNLRACLRNPVVTLKQPKSSSMPTKTVPRSTRQSLMSPPPPPPNPQSSSCVSSSSHPNQNAEGIQERRERMMENHAKIVVSSSAISRVCSSLLTRIFPGKPRFDRQSCSRHVGGRGCYVQIAFICLFLCHRGVALEYAAMQMLCGLPSKLTSRISISVGFRRRHMSIII